MKRLLLFVLFAIFFISSTQVLAGKKKGKKPGKQSGRSNLVEVVCPVKKGYYQDSVFTRGKVMCLYRRGALPIPSKTVTIGSKTRKAFRSCLRSNKKYGRRNGRQTGKMYCSTRLSQMKLNRTAYKWSSRKKLWRKHIVIKMGATNRVRNGFTPCRVRINKAYYLGYLLLHHGRPTCMFPRNGRVDGRYHYDLLLLTKKYGFPAVRPRLRESAFDLFWYRRQPHHTRQVLCLSHLVKDWFDLKGVTGHLPGVRINNICLTHFNGQIYVPRRTKRHLWPGGRFGLE